MLIICDFFCLAVVVDFTHIRQDSSTDTGSNNINIPNAGKATLRNMDDQLQMLPETYDTVLAKQIPIKLCAYIMECNSYNKTTSRQYMMTSSNGNIFRVIGPLWGEFTGYRWIPLTKASDAELWCFSLIGAWTKSLSKPSRHRWFEPPPRSLRRHCNEYEISYTVKSLI